MVALCFILIIFESIIQANAKSISPNDVNTSIISNAIDGLFVGYDNRLRPYFGGPPLNISVYMSVVSFSTVYEKDMEFSLDVFFKQAWRDPRLRHSAKMPFILPGSQKEKFWIPDTFFLNVKTARFHQVPAANTRIVVTPDGDIELSERLTVSASCRMDLRMYPLDQQTCVLEILSYSFDINDIDYRWKAKEDLIILDGEMNEFELKDSRGERKQVEYVIGTYTHLVAKFVFRRRLAYSFIQIYSPTFLIVVLSWLSFWISKDAVPARVALGITTVLTIVTLMGSLRNSVPKVSYIKAIDLYLIVSFIFVFGTLLEYIAVLMHSDSKKLKHARGKIKKRADIETITSGIPYRPCSATSTQSRGSVVLYSSYQDPATLRTSRVHLEPPRPPPPPPRRGPVPGAHYQPAHQQPQMIPGPAISHSPYAEVPRGTRILEWIRKIRIPLLQTHDKSVDIFDRFARVLFPMSFMIFNIGYYFTYR